MALTDGPLVFPTDGTDASLTGLPTVASFAATVNWPLTLVHMFQGEQPTSSRRIAGALAALPAQVAPPDVLAMPSTNLASVLNDRMPSGVLALLSARRRFPNHLWSNATYTQLARDWNAPLLMLPDSGGREIRRVLFPADLAPRSAAAFDEAIGLCEAFGAELHVLHVFGEDRRLPAEMDLDRRATARSPRELFDMDRTLMQNLVERASSRGVFTSAKTVEGRAHVQILHYTAANEIDLILMPSHGPRSMEDILLGTTTARVIQKTSVPVIALRSAIQHPGVSTSA